MSRVLENCNDLITQHYSSKHKGLDIVGEGHRTDYVTAHTGGEVVLLASGHVNCPGASGNASYGNFVKLRHANGYCTLYAHMKNVCVVKGQTVKAGERLGYMGNSGNSYGAHLHFEVRTPGNERIDPEPYLSAGLPGIQKGEDIMSWFIRMGDFGSKEAAEEALAGLKALAGSCTVSSDEADTAKYRTTDNLYYHTTYPAKKGDASTRAGMWSKGTVVDVVDGWESTGNGYTWIKVLYDGGTYYAAREYLERV